LAVFEGVPVYNIKEEQIKNEIEISDLLCETTNIFSSKGELRRLIKGNGLSINNEKVQNPNMQISSTFLINNKYILIQKGKKHHYINLGLKMRDLTFYWKMQRNAVCIPREITR